MKNQSTYIMQDQVRDKIDSIMEYTLPWNRAISLFLIFMIGLVSLDALVSLFPL